MMPNQEIRTIIKYIRAAFQNYVIGIGSQSTVGKNFGSTNLIAMLKQSATRQTMKEVF